MRRGLLAVVGGCGLRCLSLRLRLGGRLLRRLGLLLDVTSLAAQLGENLLVIGLLVPAVDAILSLLDAVPAQQNTDGGGLDLEILGEGVDVVLVGRLVLVRVGHSAVSSVGSE